jgi:hypothetical protein
MRVSRSGQLRFSRQLRLALTADTGRSGGSATVNFKKQSGDLFQFLDLPSINEPGVAEAGRQM